MTTPTTIRSKNLNTDALTDGSKFTAKLCAHQDIAAIKLAACELLKSIHNVQQLAHSPELLVSMCAAVHVSCARSNINSEEEQKALVLSAYKDTLKLDQNQIANTLNSILFFQANGLVQFGPLSRWQRLCDYLKRR